MPEAGDYGDVSVTGFLPESELSMSYILDALKKLENERGKKKAAAGIVNISGELFKDAPQRTSGRGIGRIAVVVVAASLVTFGATWYFLRGGRERDISKSHPPLPVSVARNVTPSPPHPVAIPTPASVPQPNAAAVPLPAQAQSSQAVKHVDSAAKHGVASAAKARKGKRKKERKMVQHAPLPKEKPVPMDTKLSPPPTDIKISGIAWQDERAARRAVVNGFLAREGTMVSGAKITDILKDRVRFSQDGKIFEIPFVASGGMSELGK